MRPLSPLFRYCLHLIYCRVTNMITALSVNAIFICNQNQELLTSLYVAPFLGHFDCFDTRHTGIECRPAWRVGEYPVSRLSKRSDLLDVLKLKSFSERPCCEHFGVDCLKHFQFQEIDGPSRIFAD